MNRVGAASNGLIAKRLGLKHSTAHRILMVLADLGYLRHDPLGHQFVLSGRVREFDRALPETPPAGARALPKMSAWTRRHGLPLHLATAEDGVLTVCAATDAHWPLATERLVAGSRLPGGESSEARVLRAFARGAPGPGTRALDGEFHLSVPVIAAGALIGCLSLRCPESAARARGAVARWSKSLAALAADLAGDMARGAER
jgi:DNA-binding IclR family transcriptional regulator